MLRLKGFQMDGDQKQVEYVPINLFKNEHISTSFTKLNPAQQVPLLILHDEEKTGGKSISLT